MTPKQLRDRATDLRKQAETACNAEEADHLRATADQLSVSAADFEELQLERLHRGDGE
jgi:hypothetical protein